MRRLASWLLDSGPVLILAAIAGAGSFTHIRDTAIDHGQTGWMSWAVARMHPSLTPTPSTLHTRLDRQEEPTMRIRLDGTRAEITDALFRLRQTFAVSGVSRSYPDRTRPHNWRVFVTTTPRQRR